MSQSFAEPFLAPIIWNQCFLYDFICLSNLNTVEEDCGYSFMDNISIRLWYGFWLDHCNTLISCCILDHCPAVWPNFRCQKEGFAFDSRIPWVEFVVLWTTARSSRPVAAKQAKFLPLNPLCCLCLRSLCWYGVWCWPNMQRILWSNLTNLVLSAQRTLFQKLCVQVQISLPGVFL